MCGSCCWRSLTSALALDPHRSLDHYGHQAWRTDSGLPQNTVHSILQTRDGFVWLGTDGGLVRFDGIDFVTFDAENTPQFKSDTVSDLLEDHSGNLWISTAAGLVSYRGGGFAAYTAAQGLPADTVWFSYEDRRHRLWAITAAGPAWFDGKIFRPLAGAQAAAPSIATRWLRMAGERSGWGAAAVSSPLDTTRHTPSWRAHLLSGSPGGSDRARPAGQRLDRHRRGTGALYRRHARVPVALPASTR